MRRRLSNFDHELRWALVSSIVVVAVVIASLFPLRAMFDGSEAVLAFVGVLVTATVTLVGLSVTRQANLRLAEEKDRSERRLSEEHAKEQQRLRLDAAMQASALLAPVGDQLAAPVSVASGLLALTKLDNADLAVALLVDLWSNRTDRVSAETAVLVIDSALRSTNPKAQLVAAELLCRNAQCLNACNSLHWPSVVDGCWDPTFGPKTKLLILEALLEMTLAGPGSENALRAVAVRLYGAWDSDPDCRVKGCVGTLIRALVPKLESYGYNDFMHGNGKVLLQDFQRAAAQASTNPDGYLDRLVVDRADRLRVWSQTCDQLDSDHGQLATAA